MPERIENRMVVNSQWDPVCKPVFRCEECGGAIYAEDDYYDFNGDIICEDCASRYMKEHFRQTAR